MQKPELISQVYDLFESYGKESTTTRFIETEILPLVKLNIMETDMVGIGEKFNTLLDKIRNVVKQSGDDKFRNLRQMLKISLKTYIQNSQDVPTARGIYNRALHKGIDVMLSATAAILLANALMRQNPQGAKTLVQGVLKKLGGPQDNNLDIGGQVQSDLSELGENASASAVSVGNVATVPLGKKKKKDSIFAEGDVVQFPGNNRENIKPGYGDNVINMPKVNPNTDVFSVHPISNRKTQQYDEMMLKFPELMNLFKKYRVVSNHGPSDIWDSGIDDTLFMLQTHDYNDINQAQMDEINAGINNGYKQRIIRENKFIQYTYIDTEPEVENNDELKFSDLENTTSDTMNVMRNITNTGHSELVNGVLVDPSTSELIVNAHECLNQDNRQRYINKPINEMIRIAHRLVESGFLSVEISED